MRLWAVAFLLTATGLAGCADEAPPPDEPQDTVDRETYELADGKGAIAGLLVDDRFRPIQLTDDPQTEFQAKGFILLQETGEQVQTSANGEFTFVDLEPGQYTLRTTIEGHEASPAQMQVTDGQFSEIQLLARRTSSEGGSIITDEYSIFVPCVFTAVVAAYSPDCTFDQSGDTQRFAFYPNYTAVQNVSYMVTEMLLGTPAGGAAGAWGVSVRDPGAIRNGIYYAEGTLVTGDYLKLVNKRGDISEYGTRNTFWNNTIDFQVALFGEGVGQDTPYGDLGLFGAGAQAGQQAQFIVTLFLGEPDVDIETYCVLCPGT